MTGQRRLRAVPEQGGVRTVLYRRVSAVMGRSGDEFLSPDLQASAMRDMIRRRGLVEVAVVDDIDVSGRTFERAGIQRVLEMARNREIDVVALYDLSRLGRNTAESLRTITELRELGVSVMSTVEQIDDTPEGQFQLGVFLGMAQLYSDQIARRWQQVVAHRAEQGRMHARAPVGYRRAGRMVEPDPVTAPLVKELFRRYAAGEGIWPIRQWWSGRVRPTSYNQIKRILRNPAYVGKVRYHDQVLPGAHEPLVSERVWRQVQDRIARDRTTPSRTLAYTNPFARLAVCDLCDRTLHVHANPRGTMHLMCPGRSRLYVCRGVGTPPLVRLEAAVLDAIDAEVGALSLDLGAARAARRARSAAAKVDARRVRLEVAELERAIARANADRLRRKMPEHEAEAAVALLRAELEPLRVALREAEDRAAVPMPEATVRLAVGLRKAWPRMTSEQKNRALRAIVKQVRVRPHDGRRSQPMGERVEVVFR